MSEIDYSSHKFNLGDRVFNSVVEQEGTVIGIKLHTSFENVQSWHYRLDGITFAAASWWSEKQLKSMSDETINTQGLYGKYIIQKADGSHVDPSADYFVLRLDKPENLFERRALWFYADCIAEQNPQLHADIKNRISEHDFRIAREESSEEEECETL